jgi:Fe-S cluster assembly ATP-binding protein
MVLESTLASIIAGNLRSDHEKSLRRREDLRELAPEERAHKGVFLSFQYPVEIPGVD